MRAEQKIISLLDSVREKGLLQSEIAKILNLSKSTVSEILSELEEQKVVHREEVSPKSYRVWLLKFFPGSIEGILRIGILKASEYTKLVSAGEKVGAIFRVYRNGIEATKDLIRGIVDIVASPFITQAFFGVLMKNITIFRVVAMNGSGIVHSNGRGFGCSEFSTMERVLRKYLKAKNMREEIRFFDSAEEMIAKLETLRGMAVWEPYLSMFDEKELFNETIGDFVCCTLAVNNHFLKVNKILFDEFLNAFDRSGAEEGVETLTKLTGFSQQVIKKSLSSYIFDAEFEDLKKEIEELRFGRVEEILCFY
ncbi:MAG: MarR family transcriptional regulator [Archaeoglobaceae archaeon]